MKPYKNLILKTIQGRLRRPKKKTGRLRKRVLQLLKQLAPRQERLEAETQGQRQHRLHRISANQDLRLASETEEARSARLQRLRENGRLRLAPETEDARGDRLQRLKANQQLRLTACSVIGTGICIMRDGSMLTTPLHKQSWVAKKMVSFPYYHTHSLCNLHAAKAVTVYSSE